MAEVTLSARDAAREADMPRDCEVAHFGAEKPLKLDAGVEIAPFQIAYKTYGTLDAARANAVLVCHALTGDQHVASRHPVTGKPGWWETMVGPGRPVDTERYFVICANVIGGCMGSTGPASTNPPTGQPWGLDFPVVTIRDMVRAQAMLLDHLGIGRLFAVVGGSMGGMQVLQWAASYPERVFAALPIACATRHSAQNIAFHEVGRQAIMADPEWRGGRYHLEGGNPRRGLAVARMGAHITYLSDPRCTANSAASFAGHMPRTDMLPYRWYDTPNIHHCTVKDFRTLCVEVGVKMERAVALNAWGSPLRLNAPWWFWNLFGEQAVFLLSRRA